MTAYTSLASGNWNDATKWTPSGFPSSASDTATIAANTNMTVPAAVVIDCGAIGFNAGTSGRTTVTINGELNLHADMVPGVQADLVMGPDAILDLNGHAVAPTAACGYRWNGTAGHPFVIRSTGSPGTFRDGAFQVDNQSSYGDISGLIDAALGRNHTTVGGTLSYDHIKFHDCTNTLQLESTGNQTTQNFSLTNCDFSDPTNADPLGDGAFQPFLDGDISGSPSGTRVVTGCTFSTNGATKTYRGVSKFFMTGLIFTNNVEVNYRLGPAEPNTDFETCLLANTVDDDDGNNIYFLGNTANYWKTLNGCYSYYQGGNHAFGFIPGGNATTTVTANVFENDKHDGTGAGCNWMLWAGMTNTTLVKRNVFLGEGTPTETTGPTNAVLLDISNNTSLINNFDLGPILPSLFNTEQTGFLSGTNNIYNNLIFNPTHNLTDFAVDLVSATAGQISLLDYNVGYTASGPTTPPVLYSTNVHATGGNGPHDFAANPRFVDPTRTLATWDASLGGPGTVSHALAQLLNQNAPGANPAYSVSDLVSWVRGGYVPQADALIGTGLGGANIGALTPLPTPSFHGTGTIVQHINAVAGAGGISVSGTGHIRSPNDVVVGLGALGTAIASATAGILGGTLINGGYTSNTLLRFTVEIVSLTNQPLDPDTVVFKVQDPTGVQSTPAPVRESPGKYHADFEPLSAGAYIFEWIGSGVAQVAVVDNFLVRNAVF